MKRILAGMGDLARVLAITLAAGILFTGSGLQASQTSDVIRHYTRGIEFDFVGWTIEALFVKSQTAALGLNRYLSEDQGAEIVDAYFAQVNEINVLRDEISFMYADPAISDPEAAAQEKAQRLEELERENRMMAAISETVLQQQVSTISASMGLSAGGQLIPPLLYHVTPLPMALIISPRDVIRQDVDISLKVDIPFEQIVELEQRIEKEMNVSALVVNIGGVGIYPTMVLRTTNLAWMIETIAHEWTHNFLTLRPMGMLYMQSPQLRTMNETTASLAGGEVALEVYKRFYPQFIPPETPPAEPGAPPGQTNEPPVFDFNAEMHETRVTVDQMLLEGKITQAEEYMETRRQFFRDHGYLLRRINQAYFAFYGAYADVPGGQAGEDPVGPAVRQFRAQSGSLARFLNRISWITSFERLQQAVAQGQ